MNSKVNNFIEGLNKSESGLMLGLFRIAFGIIMFYHVSLNWDRLQHYKDPNNLRFPYPELDWMPLLSYEGLLIVFFIGLVCSFAFTLGFLYKYTSSLMFLSYSYLFSLDSLYFNNHYYLLVFQMQICIVFFYGGLSKVNADWLGGFTLGGEEFTAFQNFFLGWGGMLFDLIIPFALLFRRTRWIAIILVLLFNISNHFLFGDIAAYPILASLSMLLFLEGSNRINKIQNLFGENNFDSNSTNQWTKGVAICLALYFIFQFTYPLRHLVMPGHPEWTGQGHYFAWRMKSYQNK